MLTSIVKLSLERYPGLGLTLCMYCERKNRYKMEGDFSHISLQPEHKEKGSPKVYFVVRCGHKQKFEYVNYTSNSTHPTIFKCGASLWP